MMSRISSTESVTTSRFRSSGEIVPCASWIPLTQSSSPFQYDESYNTIGNRLIFRVWMRVRASNSSSRVPNPPGKMAKPLAYLTNIVFRTKK